MSLIPLIEIRSGNLKNWFYFLALFFSLKFMILDFLMVIIKLVQAMMRGDGKSYGWFKVSYTNDVNGDRAVKITELLFF